MAQNYKETLNLPKTDFRMKASLTTREPEILKMSPARLVAVWSLAGDELARLVLCSNRDACAGELARKLVAVVVLPPDQITWLTADAVVVRPLTDWRVREMFSALSLCRVDATRMITTGLSQCSEF